MTRKKPKQIRIDEIIFAAVDEFIDNGYDGASMESIAARAGISKGGVYYHFKSKDEVLLAATKKMSEPIIAIMKEAGAFPKVADGLRFFARSYLFLWLNDSRKMTFYAQTMAKALETPAIWQEFEKYTEGMLTFFSRLFARGIEQGEFVDHNAMTSALTFMATLEDRKSVV